MGKQREESDLLEVLDEETRDPFKAQDEVLSHILMANLRTEYLQKWGITEPAIATECFKKNVPIVEYKDISADIQRLANGDKAPIFFNEPVARFIISSGTSSGVHKLYPKPENHLERCQRYEDTADAILQKHFPEMGKGKRLDFLFVREQGTTPCGMVAQTAVTCIVQRFTSSISFSSCISPAQVLLCSDHLQSTYCQLLCGLIHSQQVVSLGTYFASTLVRIIRSLEDFWTDLCHDLETGHLNAKTITSCSVRDAMSRVLRPNPELARRIRAECSKKQWQGIIKRLWPNAKFIETIVTGSMQQYISTLEYYSGGMHIVSKTYVSSETFLGLNMNPLFSPSETAYLLAPKIAYFEFLPVDDSTRSGQQVRYSQERCDQDLRAAVVDLAGVQKGKEYELVITNYSGLYRYRMGDILRMEGYYNASPTFSFVCRKNVILSIDSDKTDERDLHNAVAAAAATCMHTRVMIRDYTSYADLESKPPHYVIFWELAETEEENTEEGKIRSGLYGNGDRVDDNSEKMMKPVKEEELEECCFVMEDKLSSTYRRGRREGAIGPLEIRLVAKGSFEKLMDSCVEGGGVNLGQVKVPRCLKGGTSLRLEVLERCVYQSAFSPRLPFYSLSQLLPNAHSSPQIAIPNNSK